MAIKGISLGLSTAAQAFSSVLQVTLPQVLAHLEPNFPVLDSYDGNPTTWNNYLAHCLIIFGLQLSSVPTERSTVAFFITRLSGRARDWAATCREAGDTAVSP